MLDTEAAYALEHVHKMHGDIENLIGCTPAEVGKTLSGPQV